MGRLPLPFVLAISVGCAHGGPTSAATVDDPSDPIVDDDTTTDEPATPLAPFDPRAYVDAYARPRLALFHQTDADAAEIDGRMRTERDASARRAIARASVLAHLELALAAADAGDVATVSSEKRAIDRSLRIARRGNRDAQMLADLAFASVYLAYRAGASDAIRLSDDFFMRHVVDRELLRVDTMIRGELALGRGDAARARAIFGLLVGDARDPLHAYGLYRSAATHCTSREDEPCRAMLERVRTNGCDPSSPSEAKELGARAVTELGLPPVPRRDRDRLGPVYCSRDDVARFSDPLFAR